MIAAIRALKYALLGGALAGVLFTGGFLLFANTIEPDTAAPQGADGIVALTGGRARIAQAVELLARGQAKRLLITGVHPSTKASELQRLVPGGAEIFPCCVDLGRTALDTRGNAAETSAWAAKHNFSSLIVVTSSYHMRRTLLEFSRAMPQMHLVPHGVVSPDLQMKSWWSHGGTMRVLFFEYVKYLNALTGYAGARIAATSGFGAAAGSPAPAN